MAFDSSQQALRAEMLLEDDQVGFELVPTPGEITAGCAMSIAFAEAEFEQVLTIVRRETIEIRGIFLKKGTVYSQTV